MAPRTRVQSLVASMAMLALPACIGPLRLLPNRQPPAIQTVESSRQPATASAAPALRPEQPGFSQPVTPQPLAPIPMPAPIAPMPVERPADLNRPLDSLAFKTVSARYDSPIVEALRSYQLHEPEQAAISLQKYDRANQEILATLLPLAVLLGESSVSQSSPAELAVIVEQLNALSRSMSQKASVKISNLTLCRASSATTRFGHYQPVDSKEPYDPGELMAVYLELQNFSEQKPSNEFQTRIGLKVEILDSAGQVALAFDRTQAETSLSPRRDLCAVVRFPLPELRPGDFSLKIQATDLPTGRTDQQSIPFRVKNRDSARRP